MFGIMFSYIKMATQRASSINLHEGKEAKIVSEKEVPLFLSQETSCRYTYTKKIVPKFHMKSESEKNRKQHDVILHIFQENSIEEDLLMIPKLSRNRIMKMCSLVNVRNQAISSGGTKYFQK